VDPARNRAVLELHVVCVGVRARREALHDRFRVVHRDPVAPRAR
jgi:hypothetical protein